MGWGVKRSKAFILTPSPPRRVPWMCYRVNALYSAQAVSLKHNTVTTLGTYRPLKE